MFPDRLYYELITMVDFKNTLNEEMRNLKVGKQKKVDPPDIAYLERYAEACCSPFGAAEQRSQW